MVHTAVYQQQENRQGVPPSFSIMRNPSLSWGWGVKLPVCCIGHSLTFSTEVKERGKLYHYLVYGF